MHVNKILRVLLCLGFSCTAKGQVVKDLFDAQIGYEKLLGNETLEKPRRVMSSSLLGKHVVDLAPMFRLSGVELGESDVVIYGPDTRLMYVKSNSESLSRIKNLCQMTETSKSVYRVIIDDAKKIDLASNFDKPILDVMLVSGEPIRIRSGEKTVTEVLLTEGVVDTGETQFEIKISGLAELMMQQIPEIVSCKVKLSNTEILHDYPLELDANKFLRIRVDRVTLDKNRKFQDRSSTEKQQILDMVQSEINQIKK
jgi:hypothetical protein